MPPRTPTLPPELFFKILHLAANSRSVHPNIPIDRCRIWRQSNSLLARAALVCRLWRAPAQEVLWEKVEIGLEEEARAFVEGSAGRRRTRELRVLRARGEVGWEELDPELVRRVVESCLGLKNLVLATRVAKLESLCFEGMSGAFGASFAGVR